MNPHFRHVNAYLLFKNAFDKLYEHIWKEYDDYREYQNEMKNIINELIKRFPRCEKLIKLFMNNELGAYDQYDFSWRIPKSELMNGQYKQLFDYINEL